MIDPVKRQKEAKRLKKQGLTVREIARKLNSTFGSIQVDLYGQKKKFTHAEHQKRALEWGKRRQQAYLLREQGLTFKEIGKRMNVTQARAAELYKAYKSANIAGDTSWHQPLPTTHEEAKTAYDTLFLSAQPQPPPPRRDKQHKYGPEQLVENRKIVVMLRDSGMRNKDVAHMVGISKKCASRLYNLWKGRL